jgi:CelD/BcsL family acetyltransferase involved in cellulose biosynthesis
MQPFPKPERFAFKGPDFAPTGRPWISPPANDTRRGTDRTLVTGICSLTLVTRRAEFDALEHEWNALFERSGRPWQIFQTFHWVWHWANHYLDDHTKLSIVIGRREDRLVMVWPLVSRRVAGLAQLSWMGEPVSEYGDVLLEQTADAPDLLRQAWTFVRSLAADLIYLRKIRHDAAIFPLLGETGAICTASSCAPYLDLASAKDFETYERRYSSKARSSRRRALRRLNEMGSVSFEQHMHGPAARDLVGQALAMKRAWLAQRGRWSRVLWDSRFGGFLEDVTEAGTRPTGARTSAILCNGRAIGVEISFASKGHVFGHVIAHDLAFEKRGVGALLAQYSIRTAHEQGHAVYDLLAPDDAYKMNWADASVAIDDYAIPISRIGGVYARLWFRFARRRLKSFANRVPGRLAPMLSAICRRMAGLA